MRYETAIRFLRLDKEYETIPAAACVARFWAQPPKYSIVYSMVYRHAKDYVACLRPGKEDNHRVPVEETSETLELPLWTTGAY